MKEIVQTDQAPEAIGPYSQAVIHNNIIYCSGQIPLDPNSMEIVGEDVETQTKQVMRNLEAVLEKAGGNFNKVLKCSIFLADMNDFSVVNRIYGSYFTSKPPARETVAVKTLPKEVLVEISCIASK